MNIAPYPVTIPVEIDSEVASIVPEFLENRKKDCLLVRSLLEAGSFKEIHTVGHKMKGAGGSYGFDVISEIGQVMEEAALTGNRDVISDSVLQLSSYLDRVRVVYV